MDKSENFSIEISYNPENRFKIYISNSVDKASKTFFAPHIDPNVNNLMQLLQDYLQTYYPILLQNLEVSNE